MKRPSTELIDHGAVWFAINTNPNGYIKGTSPYGLMANMTSLFEDWGDANTADRFLNIYFYELNPKQLLQLIFPLSNIVNKCKILWKCASRNSKYCPQIPLPPCRHFLNLGLEVDMNYKPS